MPDTYVAEAIVEQIGDVRGLRILLPRADIARKALAEGLRAGGAQVDEVAAYRTVPGAGSAEMARSLQASTVDAITFTSSSTVRYTLEGLQSAGLDAESAVELLKSRPHCVHRPHNRGNGPAPRPAGGIGGAGIYYPGPHGRPSEASRAGSLEGKKGVQGSPCRGFGGVPQLASLTNLRNAVEEEAVRVGAMARLLRMPDLLAQGLVLRDLQSFVRVHFLYAAASTGLLRALRRPTSTRDLVHDLHVKRPNLLEGLLALGVALGELSVRDGVYRLRGVRSKALVGKRGDPLVATIEEYATYHSSVYRELAARMRGAPLGDYLRGTGDMIARSSRVLEPFVADFARMTVEKRGPVRILEVGCGSGIYLKHAAHGNRHASGAGIDLQPEVVELAARNLARWGLDGRFKVMQGISASHPPVLRGPSTWPLCTTTFTTSSPRSAPLSSRL